MKIFTQRGGIASTNAYLVVDEPTKQAVIFDAPDHTVAPLIDVAKKNGYDVIGLWLTHGHFDHVADHALVTQAFPKAKVLMHPLDERKLIKPGAQFFALPFEIPPRKADQYVNDFDVLKLGDLEVHVIHTPGHAPGHVAYYIPSAKALIGGDLIILGAVGRTDLPDAKFEDLEASIRKIMRLPPETMLHPGHGGSSTLEHERQTNQYVIDAMRGI